MRDKNTDNYISQFLCLDSYLCLFKSFTELFRKVENVCFHYLLYQQGNDIEVYCILWLFF